MAEPTRAEHMAWCKQRALAYLDDPKETVQDALASIMSDLKAHPETRNHAGIQLTMMMMMNGHLRDRDSARRHIEGFR